MNRVFQLLLMRNSQGYDVEVTTQKANGVQYTYYSDISYESVLRIRDLYNNGKLRQVSLSISDELTLGFKPI